MKLYSIKHKLFPLRLLMSILALAISLSSSAQCIDNQFENSHVTTSDFAQSFTFPSSGCGVTMQLCHIHKDNPETGSDTLNVYIYAGETVTGTPQYTLIDEVISKNATEKFIAILGGSGSRSLIAGQQYTFHFVIRGTGDWQANGNNPYSGGRAYYNGSFDSTRDFYFRLYTTPVLPVDLVLFEAEKQTSTVALTWQTASEQNNEGFDIERSPDGKTWKTIDFVKGHGTTDEVADYHFIDETPLRSVNYYRLKQIDLDGQFEYSDIVKTADEGTLAIYPNPTSGELHINGGKGQITIYNLLGQTVKTFDLKDDKAEVFLWDIDKGTYYLESINVNGQRTVEPFVKQ